MFERRFKIVPYGQSLWAIKYKKCLVWQFVTEWRTAGTMSFDTPMTFYTRSEAEDEMEKLKR